jgi:hypothetical protein
MNRINKNRKPKKSPPPPSPNFVLGYKAFATPEQMSCPFKINTVQAREWQRGYDKAYFDNLEKLRGANR